MATDYELVVGIEVHAQLLTKAKLFCACPNRFGDAPNVNTCPVCLGHPGVLPVVNRQAVALLVRAALALNCTIHPLSRFARKNYYYPDLPKGYQISQYELPVATDGWLEVKNAEGQTRKIRIRRIHLEEDAGKLTHEGVSEGSLVDLNRAGTPLMEIVTEPDFRSADEAYDYVTQLRQILQYLEVCDGNMEEGSLRCEPNISLRPRGEEQYGVKIELKNINSCKAVKRGIEYEVRRQTHALARGEKLHQETRGWDENKEESFLMRSKEEAHDYRYFPDPDLPPLHVDEAWRDEIRRALPELPRPRVTRMTEQYAIPAADAEVLGTERLLADYFENVAKASGDGKAAANWVMGEVLRVLKAQSLAIDGFQIAADRMAGLIKLIGDGKISGTIGKKVFEMMLGTSESAADLVAKHNLAVVSDEGAIQQAVAAAIDANPESVQSYLAGKEKAIGFLVGQVMRQMKGKADPATLNRLMKAALDALKK